MARTEVLSPTSTLYAGAKGSVVITQLAPGHVLLTFYGYNDGEAAEGYYKALDSVVEAAGSIVIYMDSREQSGISAQERDRATQWSKALGGRYKAGHLLFRSRLLELAVAIANMVLGGVVKTYSKAEAFERVIAQNVPGFTRLPDFKQAATRSAFAS